jgi:demethylmenaquinone methyltransferase / 2-methoxy-6-polyprenyl-1,4-benzoquinol methylase
MANKFFAPGETRAARVHHLFESIAPRYDLINDVQSFGLHRLWKRRLIAAVGLKRGERALDVCCGTGDIALRLMQAGGSVVALDFSMHMLLFAKERASLTSVRADALCLPFPDAQFDVVTIGYGLRNLASFEAGLREMVRVLRSGGRLVVLDFGKPENAIWRGLYLSYLNLGVPLLGQALCGNRDAYAYILESLKHFPSQTGIGAMMREIGLKNVKTTHLLGGIMGLNYGEKVDLLSA